MENINFEDYVKSKFELLINKYNFELIYESAAAYGEHSIIYYNNFTKVRIYIFIESGVIIYIKIGRGLIDKSNKSKMHFYMSGYSLFEYAAEFTNGVIKQKDFAILKIKYDPFYTFEEKFEYYSSDVDLYIEILDKYLGDVLLGKKWIYPRTMRLFYKIKNIFK
jgi:hypothetical protein